MLKKYSINAPDAFFAIFLLVCVFGGGASRNDVLSQPLVWLAAIASLAVSIAKIDRAGLRRIGPLAGFLCACAFVILLQLIPLPPSIWTSLPGREPYADLASIARFEQPWRTISITPDLTWSSLLSLLPPAAMVCSFVTISPRLRRSLLLVLLSVIFFSAVLGLAQLGSGNGGPLRFYRITNDEFSVGIFANRNHQALLLAIGMPALTIAGAVYNRASNEWIRLWGPMLLILFLIPLIVVTGSRFGLVIGVVMALVAIAFVRTRLSSEFQPRKSAVPKWQKMLPYGIVVASILVTVAFSRAVAIDRLLATSTDTELRLKLLNPLVEFSSAFFPVGSGFGSFQSVYTRFEPNELLNIYYVNQAHNDLLQLTIEGGLLGVLLLAAFLIWLFRRSLALWRPRLNVTPQLLIARFAACGIYAILVASLVDYPLRTPLFAVILTLLALWVNEYGRKSINGRHREKKLSARSRSQS